MPLPLESTSGSRKDEASGQFSLTRVNTLGFLQCFDTVGWVTERAYGL